MRTTHFCTRALFLSAALIFLTVPAANAAYIINITQVGSNVVTSASGSLDTTDLTFVLNASRSTMINGAEGQVILGPTGSSNDAEYSGATGPTSFGTVNSNTSPSSGSGPLVGVEGNDLHIFVPSGYASGTALATSTDTYNTQTLSSLGLTSGTYTYSWGTGPDADSLTVNIGVPEPTTLTLMALSGIGLLRRRHRISA